MADSDCEETPPSTPTSKDAAPKMSLRERAQAKAQAMKEKAEAKAAAMKDAGNKYANFYSDPEEVARQVAEKSLKAKIKAEQKKQNTNVVKKMEEINPEIHAINTSFVVLGKDLMEKAGMGDMSMADGALAIKNALGEQAEAETGKPAQFSVTIDKALAKKAKNPLVLSLKDYEPTKEGYAKECYALIFGTQGLGQMLLPQLMYAFDNLLKKVKQVYKQMSELIFHCTPGSDPMLPGMPKAVRKIVTEMGVKLRKLSKEQIAQIKVVPSLVKQSVKNILKIARELLKLFYKRVLAFCIEIKNTLLGLKKGDTGADDDDDDDMLADLDKEAGSLEEAANKAPDDVKM